MRTATLRREFLMHDLSRYTRAAFSYFSYFPLRDFTSYARPA